MSDIARLGFEIDSTQARTAAGDLDKLSAAALKTETAAKKLSVASRDLLRDESGRFLSTAQAASKYGDEIEQLRTKYNPLYAASKQFEAQQGELQRALALGAISVAQYDAALEGLQGGMIRSGGAADKFGKSMAASAQHTTNLMFQFQDIAMMLQAGQNPLMLAMQQGTQVSGVFHQMEQSGQSAFQGIKGGLLAMVSPMSLLTIGAIAGGAALFQWGMSALGAGANVKTFQENIDAAQSSIDNLRTVTDLYSEDGLERLRQKYGEVNAEITALVENQRILAMQEAAANVQSALSALTSDLGNGLFSTQVWDIASAFETSSDRARGLLEVMRNIDGVDGLDRQLAVIESLKGELSAATNGFTDMNAEQVKMLSLLTNAEDQMRQLAAAADDANNSDMGNLISQIDAVRSAAASAAAYVALLNSTGQSSGPDSVRTKQFGGGAFAAPVIGAGLPSIAGTGSGSGTGSAGGGGGGRTDPYADNLTRLIESLQTEQETVDAWYNENLTILNDRRAQEILGEQAHKDALLDLEREYLEKKQGLNDGYGEFSLASADKLFGELNSLSGSGYAGLLKAQKAFGAASALVNTYTAASQTLADPSLPFFAKFAAVAKTVAAGMGLVNAIKGGGGSVSGGASATTSATTATRAEPERVTRVELQGEDWIVSLAETMMTQIYDASKNGRVIVARA